MKINVGSKNEIKVAAVKEAVNLYPQIFVSPEVTAVEVSTELYGHPKSLDETMNGAIERARASLKGEDYSFGLEGGLIGVPAAVSGYMEVEACAIYDGHDFFLGLSSAFEWPRKVTEMILSGHADASKAFQELGLTAEKKLGAVKGGIIGMLTAYRMTREDQHRQSIIAAMIRLERRDLYRGR